MCHWILSVARPQFPNHFFSSLIMVMMELGGVKGAAYETEAHYSVG